MAAIVSTLLTALLLAGCASHTGNVALRGESDRPAYRFESFRQDRDSNDDLLLMLAFSGGGTRAAALAYGVLEELRRTDVGQPGQPRTLLDEVDLISSVSGGSFTAAYYALWGDRTFVDFESRFLKKSVQTGLLLRTLAPWNQLRLVSPRFARSDLAAEYYDELLFGRATFGQLNASGARPFLSINATDVASGARFEFTQDEFDLIGSDLAEFPISRAVAASSAFPVVLTPIVLKNQSAGKPGAEPGWVREILDNPGASSRLRYVAAQARSYGESHRRFIHLVDGGLSDNLGLRGGIDRAMGFQEFNRVPGLPSKLPSRIAIVIVNAHTSADYGWDSREHPVKLPALLGSLSQVAVSHYSFETIELFREVMKRLSQERRGNTGCGDIDTCIVELHFRQIADEADRKFYNSVPTTLQLKDKTVDRLRAIAARELQQNAEFRRLLAELRGPDKSATPVASREMANRTERPYEQ